MGNVASFNLFKNKLQFKEVNILYVLQLWCLAMVNLNSDRLVCGLLILNRLDTASKYIFIAWNIISNMGRVRLISMHQETELCLEEQLYWGKNEYDEKSAFSERDSNFLNVSLHKKLE